MSYPLTTRTIVPNTHGRAAPHITVAPCHNGANGLVTQLTSTRERTNFIASTVKAEQAAVRTNEQITMPVFGQRQTSIAVKQVVPAIRLKAVLGRIVARHTRRCSNPQQMMAVIKHSKHPVVTELSTPSVFVKHREKTHSTGASINTSNATTEGAKVEMALAVVD